MSLRSWNVVLLALLAVLVSTAGARAQFVAGGGFALSRVGDDFEDPEWAYQFNTPKSSADIDKQGRGPLGRSLNGRWHEGERGQPDVIRRVETPAGGLPGSTGALLIATRNSGIPGVNTRESQQDDLVMTVNARTGGYIPVTQWPSVVVRVYVPEFDQWEPRDGSSFAFRATVRGTKPGERESEPYWPGIFLQHSRSRGGESSAYFLVRASERGGDYRGPAVTPGWWTLGMGFSPDGRIHYFASEGIDNLTIDDRIAVHYSYGFRCEKFRNAFFDVFNANNGRTWSTGWVIDDPTLYVASERYAERIDSRGNAPRRR
ncbi:MAG: hypothetical protein KDA63_16435 [Planctomycetales bacterium]|nr:hypothetical protein [Planctomycetales bacterium]